MGKNEQPEESPRSREESSPETGTVVMPANLQDDGLTASEEPALGVALDTGNYKALLDRYKRASSHSDPENPADENKSSKNMENQQDDTTVKGMPLETGNYQSLIRSAMMRSSMPNASRDSSSSMHRPSDIYELPGNARAKEHRARGYSALRQGQYRQHDRRSSLASSETDRNSCLNKPRVSCFDRRSSSAAIVPSTGWISVQHPTFRTWQRRYAELAGVEFKYCKAPGKKPKGFGVVESFESTEDAPFGLNLFFAAGDQLQISCENEQERAEWLEAFERAIERTQNQSSHSKTSYTLTASDQHEGYLHMQDGNGWRILYFIIRPEGKLEWKKNDTIRSGIIRSVSFADVRENALAIQLDAGRSLFVCTDTYDEQMMWYAALAAAAGNNDRVSHAHSSVKACYVQTARANHSGWLLKQTGLFKSWKRFFFTLHGIELALAKDTNSPAVVADKVAGVEQLNTKTNGLQVRLKSGREWRLAADSYETAKHWRMLLANACRRGEHSSIKKYIAGRKRKGLPPVYGGWLTRSEKNVSKRRRFYVVDGDTVGVADDVDHQLTRIGKVADVGASMDLNCGIVVTFSSGEKLKAAADSIESFKAWYECLHASAA